MRLVFFDEFQRPFESLERLELLNMEDKDKTSLMSVWLEHLIGSRLSAREQEALRYAAQPELEEWARVGM